MRRELPAVFVSGLATDRCGLAVNGGWRLTDGGWRLTAVGG